MPEDRQANIDFFLSQIERCICGLRAGDAEESLGRAEVHCAFLYLVEDGEFARRFKTRWETAYAQQNDEPWVDKPIELIPDLMACFMITLTEYMGINSPPPPGL